MQTATRSNNATMYPIMKVLIRNRRGIDLNSFIHSFVRDNGIVVNPSIRNITLKHLSNSNAHAFFEPKTEASKLSQVKSQQDSTCLPWCTCSTCRPRYLRPWGWTAPRSSLCGRRLCRWWGHVSLRRFFGTSRRTVRLDVSLGSHWECVRNR
jgi:hypothetical protein